jgi:hypothetical protein
MTSSRSSTIGVEEIRYNGKRCVVVKAMTSVDIEVPTDGKVVVPLELSGATGWRVGEKLTVQMKDGEIRIFSQAQAILRAQKWISGFVTHDRSLSNELIAERKQESLRE